MTTPAPVSVAPLSPRLERASEWSDRLVTAGGLPIEEVSLVTVGGGLGSFALGDLLRIGGVPVDGIAVLGPSEDPTVTYRRLARNSQIADDDRLRSDSSSTMGNPWGFPSYAVREAWSRRDPRPLLQVATEPVLSEFFTPRADQVYGEVRREAARIGWAAMVRPGWVRTVRRRAGGGYFTLRTDARSRSRVAVRSPHVHIAVGYPGVRLLPDVARCRAEYPAAAYRVVSAYEPHGHVYDELAVRPATVVVRGSGIVASRVLQRLIELRARVGSPDRIIHLFRTFVAHPQGSRPWFRRRGGHGFAFQPFNYPKASWGGQLRDRLEALEGRERDALLDRMGGTTTARRRSWEGALNRARAVGSYESVVGAVADLSAGDDSIVVALRERSGAVRSVEAAFLVDCTGLNAGLDEHRLLADLVAHGGATRNPKGRLDVEPAFEVRGTRSGDGRMYASGTMTLGGPYAGVDSFLGLQYAALRITDDLAAAGLCRRIGSARSIRAWWRWARNLAP